MSRTIVLVQGSWGSSAAWTPVADGLRRLGHTVFVPSLTGLGARRHLLGGHINLDTHIADVCGLIEAEGLADVDLVGHSSGGMVITGVADRFSARIRSLDLSRRFRARRRPVDTGSVRTRDRAVEPGGGRGRTAASPSRRLFGHPAASPIIFSTTRRCAPRSRSRRWCRRSA
jgi:pimeloyl-ACP methyl ester carboxylesterase